MLLNEIVRKKAVDEAEVSPYDPAKNTHTVGGAAHKHGPFDVGQEGSWVPGSDTGDPRNQKHSQDFNNKLDAYPELKRAYYNLTPKQAMNIGYRGLTRGVLNYKTTPGTTAGPFGTDVVPHKPAGAEDNVPAGRSSNPFRTPGTSTSQHNITGDPAIGTSGPTTGPGTGIQTQTGISSIPSGTTQMAGGYVATPVVPVPDDVGQDDTVGARDQGRASSAYKIQGQLNQLAQQKARDEARAAEIATANQILPTGQDDTVGEKDQGRASSAYTIQGQIHQAKQRIDRAEQIAYEKSRDMMIAYGMAQENAARQARLYALQQHASTEFANLENLADDEWKKQQKIIAQNAASDANLIRKAKKWGEAEKARIAAIPSSAEVDEFSGIEKAEADQAEND